MKKIIITSLSVVALTIGGALLMTNQQSEVSEVSEVRSAVTIDGYVEPITPKVVEKVSETEVIELQDIAVQNQSPVEEVKQKTALDYGYQYLDLSGYNLECFNKIVTDYPSHFTPENMERNIKALRAYATTCSSGIMYATGHINSLRSGGVDFFQTPKALEAVNL